MSILPQTPPALSSVSSSPSFAPEGALGIYGRNVSTASQWAKGEAVCARFALQTAARSLLPREAVSRCYRWLRPAGKVKSTAIPDVELMAHTPRSVGVDVLYVPEGQHAVYGGLETCRSVWHCPVCSSKITERRRLELSEGLHNWYSKECPGVVLLCTFTVSHTSADGLSALMDVLARARRLLLTGRWWSEFRRRHGLVGQVRALEVTHGANGWHPHLHCLLFFSEDGIDYVAVRDELKARWAYAVRQVKTGHWASLAHGVDVRYSREDVADYVAKFGQEPWWGSLADGGSVSIAAGWTVAHEMTKNPVKVGREGGRTPTQLLADYMNGDLQAGLLWQRYALVFKGQRQLFWSPHLRTILGLGVEQSDEEIADQHEAYAVLLAQLTSEQWRVVLSNDARGELLDAAASGDAQAVWRFLADLGVDVGDVAPFLAAA